MEQEEEESKTIMLRGLSLHVTEDDVRSSFSVSPFFPWGKTILNMATQGTKLVAWCADPFYLNKLAKTLGGFRNCGTC